MQTENSVLWALRLLALLGCFVFGGLLGLILLSPESVERGAKAFVVGKLQDEIAGLEAHPQGRLLNRGYELLRQGYEAELAKTQEAVAQKLPERIAAILARLCEYDCETETEVSTSLRHLLEGRERALALALAKFGQLAQERYSAILGSLIAEIRTFVASNLAIFSALLLASFLAGPRTRFLILPSLLLLSAASLAGYFYVFEQNWFYAILFERYLGFGYLGYVAFLFFWMLDIVYLKARCTRAVIDALASVFSKCGLAI